MKVFKLLTILSGTSYATNSTSEERGWPPRGCPNKPDSILHMAHKCNYSKTLHSYRCKYRCPRKEGIGGPDFGWDQSIWDCDPESSNPEWRHTQPCRSEREEPRLSLKKKCEALEEQPEWSDETTVLRCQDSKRTGPNRYRRKKYKCFGYCPDELKYGRSREIWECSWKDGEIKWHKKKSCFIW